MKKKLLFYGESPFAPTGLGRVSREMLDTFVSNFDITAIFSSHPASITQENAQLPFPFVGYTNDYPYNFSALSSAIIAGGSDYIFLFGDIDKLLYVRDQLFFIKNKNPNVKVWIYTPIDTDKFPLQYAQELNAPIYDKVIVYLPFVRNTLVNLVPSLSSKIEVIGHGVNKTIFHSLPYSRKKKLRKKFFNLKQEDRLFMMLGHNQWRKNYGDALLAWSRYHKEHASDKLYIHANPKDEGGNLIDTVIALGISDSVIFPSSDIFFKDDDINSLYNCADIFLSTSLGEGFCLPLLEAASVGLTIVCPPSTAFGDVLQGYKDVFYFVEEKKCIVPLPFSSIPYPKYSIDNIVNTMEYAIKPIIGGDNDKLFSLPSWDDIRKDWDNFIKKNIS